MPPITLPDLLLALTSSGLAVGAVSAFLTGLLWRALAEYWPGQGYQPAENWKRLVSLVLPFVVVLVCYAALVAQGGTAFTEETLWAVLYVGLVGATGKQLAFTAWQARPKGGTVGE